MGNAAPIARRTILAASAMALLLLASVTGALAQEAEPKTTPQAPLAPSPMIWDLVDTRETLSLTLRREDGLGDAPFFAACAETGKIDLRLGAPLDQVKAPGQPIAITLRAGSRSATVNGSSESVELTGSMQLLAHVKSSDPLFDVLAAGQPVALERAAVQPLVLKAIEPEVLKLFRVTCETRTEH